MCSIIISIIGISIGISYGNVPKVDSDIANYIAYNNDNFVYLSDIDYLTTEGMSQNGWSGHSIQKDKNQEGGTLSLIVDGEQRPYVKGVSIHARGWATYDISELSSKYTRFVAKLGVDAGRGNNGNLFYRIYASNDASTWDTLLQTPILTGTSEAVNVDVNIEGYNYLRIYVDPNGANTADHGTIGGAKLVTNDYEDREVFYDKLHKLEYYDELLREHDADYNMENNHRLILEREFVNKIGYWTIQGKAEIQPLYIDTFNWILSSDETLEQIIEVGEVRSGVVFMDTLHTLYQEFKDDLNSRNGYVYKKMMIALAAAYKTDNVASPLTFSTSPRDYDYVLRFRLMKQLFDTGKFDREEEFKGYHVELMRFVMQDAISNQELIWLNEYSRTKANPYDKYSYIRYRYNPSYNQAAYQDPANKEKYDAKYLLSQYNVPYGDGVVRYWMAFEYGGICWNISRIGQTINKIKGVPSVGIYQPDHEAYIIYSQRADGTGLWTQNYNIFGWGKSSTKWWGGNRYRLIFNWSDKYFSNQVMNSSNYGTSSGYLLLGQAALNRREEWKDSLYLNYLANSYENDDEKLEIYNKALDSLNINLDSFDYKINLYKRTNKSSAEWRTLAEDVINAYTYYPNAMYDILKVIKPYLTGVDRIDIDLREQEALVAGTKATDADVLQSGPAREIANTLLGRAKQQLATFSFNGDKAGKIIINDAYRDYDFNLSYSVDGGNTWSEKTTNHELQLTNDELARITADNDIKIRMDGTPKIYTIDITTGSLASNLYGNDLENRVVGITVDYEWRNSEDDPWTSYKTASPNNTGNKTLHVRMGAKGTQLPSESTTFTFTEDNQPNTRKYVPVSHLSVHAYSTQSKDSARPYYAPNAIDGNGLTFWHTDYADDVRDNEIKPFYTIKLDKPRFISALEFLQIVDPKRPSDPDPIKNARIYVSEDGEQWTEAGKIENLPQDNHDLRVIDFNESIYGEYVKIEMDTYNMFTSLSMINVFQDLTKSPRPTAGIGYSITSPTRDNVIARLVNVSATNYEITSPGGDTHVFTEEGSHSFTFTFIDKDTGLTGSSTATVDWIDRTAPIGTIEYSKTSATNSTVVATLKVNESVRVTNNGGFTTDEDGNVFDENGNKLDGYTIDEAGNLKDGNGNIVTNVNTFTHDFIDNGEFTFEFVDRAGNKGKATAKVDWIDHDAPNATLSYNIESLTNKDVVVTAEFDEEVTVMNNGGSHSYTFTDNGEFTFEFKDKAGNVNTATARVNWIDKIVPTAQLEYEYHDDKVIVRVTNSSETITFENGTGVYEFSKNGNYKISFYDKAGNEGILVAVVDSFKEPDDNSNNSNNSGENNNQSTGNNSSSGSNSNTNVNNAGSNPNKGSNNSSSSQTTNKNNNSLNSGNNNSNASNNSDNDTDKDTIDKDDDKETESTNGSKNENNDFNKVESDDETFDNNPTKTSYSILIIVIMVLAALIAVAILISRRK